MGWLATLENLSEFGFVLPKHDGGPRRASFYLRCVARDTWQGGHPGRRRSRRWNLRRQRSRIGFVSPEALFGLFGPLALAQSHSWTAAVLVDEFDIGIL